MTDRPTLEDQLAVSKMTNEDCVDALMPHVFWQTLSFWMFTYCEFLWRIIHWNWFDIWEETEDADKYRTWYIKLKRKLFGSNKPRKGVKNDRG